MNDRQEIEQIKAEMQQLSGELKSAQARLQELYQRLLQLQQKGVPAPTNDFKDIAAAPAENFTLENFIGLRLIHLVGIVVLVIGLSIGVKYAIDRELISEVARIAFAYAAGGVLYFLSWRLKKKYITFSAILFSGAMASLYFTTYAAFVYYHMMSLPLAFVLMVVLTFFTAYNAFVYNRQEIALLGLVGAYAIPFLISSNADRTDLFFTYIAIINSAVVFLAFKKGWKTVSYVAQVITWVLLIGWAMMRFESGQEWVGNVFMAFFFLLFTGNALANKLLRGQPLRVREMQQIILNNVALYFAALIMYAPAFTTVQIGSISLVFSLFTGLQAAALFYFFPQELYTKKMLALFSLSLLLVFIANQWDGITVTLLWLIVAVALFGWGVASKTVWLRMSGIVLMGVTLLKLVSLDSIRFTTIQKIIAYLTLGVLLLLVGFFYQKFREKLFGSGE